MPVAKILGASTQDAMKSDEGTGSLDTSIRQGVGKEPLLSFSRTGDSSTQWIQLLHTFDQQDLPGWSLLAPVKVQRQKCDKCAREFCSTINYRRHIRVHRKSMNFHKEPQKYKDILGAFWDKLDNDEAKEIMSFRDVNFEEVPGSSIVENIEANLRKPIFLSLTQEYVKAGSALVDIIQGRPSRLSISSQELFNVLDDASERTFLCAGTAESLKKYIFDGEAGKIGLETKNLIACTSYLVEQKLVNAWLADKDAEALRCEKLLVEEEEAAQRRQSELLERKRQRKIRQKEHKAKDRSDGMKLELHITSDTYESISSSGNTSPQISPNENIITPLDPVQLSSYKEAVDHLDSTINEPQKINNSSHHAVTRWQVAKSRRNGHYDNQNGSFLKWEQPHRNREQSVNNAGKVWTKKPKPENIVKSRVDDDADNQTAANSCQLMIGSIPVTLRNSTGHHQVNSPAAGFQENENMEIKTESIQTVRHEMRGHLADRNGSHILEEEVTSARGADRTLTTESCQNSCNVEEEGGGKLMPFSSDEAKGFLSQRWKEAISGDHVELVLTSALEPSDDHQPSDSSKGQPCGIDANVQPKFSTKPKTMKTKYIPKQRPVY